MDSRKVKTASGGEDVGKALWLDEPVVTVNRRPTVVGSFIAVAVLGFVVLGGSLMLFGVRALKDFDGLMLLFLGSEIACVCGMVAIWIRARWICVAVFDEAGVIASTLSGKYDLAWEEIVGARTYTKVQKEANKVQVRVLLLIDNNRCIEAPIHDVQLSLLLRLLSNARFKPDSEGQRLGVTKGLTLMILGSTAVIFGAWWAGHALNQFNNGILFQGNAKAILFKVAAATVLPVGGLICSIWGLYQTIVGPILYKPGYRVA